MTRFKIKNIVVASYLMTGVLTASYAVIEHQNEAEFNQQLMTKLRVLDVTDGDLSNLTNALKESCKVD